MKKAATTSSDALSPQTISTATKIPSKHKPGKRTSGQDSSSLLLSTFDTLSQFVRATGESGGKNEASAE